MPSTPIETYRRQIQKELQAGNATEHTHRPALKSLIESLAPGVTATNEPKRVECGAPDLVISRKAGHGPVTLGHIECKDLDADLKEVERDEQLKRYLPALPNLILTDYLEFRWYVDGAFRQPARLASVGKGRKLIPEKDGAEAVTQMLAEFLAHKAEPINSPKELALRMARLTHFIRDMIVRAFANKSASQTLTDLRAAFEKALIPDLKDTDFADMFAQTLAYGLFAARVNHKGASGSFKRLGAASEIPKTNPFLRQLFDTITGTALDDEPYAGFVDDLAQLLADTEMDAVLADFGKREARQDPVVHFYETFLAAYDPKLREARGVYYTPEPVVSYLVRSVDYLLKNRFGCSDGLADTATVEYEREEAIAGEAKKVKATSPRVLILDPACGTGTFLYTVIDHIREKFAREKNDGMWSGYVRNHLLPRIFGFELLMAPYAVAHFKLGMQLAGHDLKPAERERWAYDFGGNERLGVFLTNTLEQAILKAELLLGKFISDEANAAADIKRNLPILVVIGNPPYSGHSSNRSEKLVHLKPGDSYSVVSGGPLPEQKVTKVVTVKKARTIRERTFIGKLIQDYYFVDGQPLGEKNPKWLQDDYVKFIRWGQWRIERNGAGVLAFITNHGYLDNPTFRGMRQQLMNAFTEIYLLDLHGNSKKKEKCSDGSPDQNVFDIQQGVTLGTFVREQGKAGPAKVFHADLWGLRQDKYDYLLEAQVESTDWEELCPRKPFYLFKPQESHVRSEYESGWKLTEGMPVNSVGVTTGRDRLCVSFRNKEALAKLEEFASDLSEEHLIEKYGLSNKSGWNIDAARVAVRKSGISVSNVHPFCYRVLDNRKLYLDEAIVGRTRLDVMRNMLAGQNLGLCTNRELNGPFRHAMCTRHMANDCAVSLQSRERTYLLPLYLYNDQEEENSLQISLGIKMSDWPEVSDIRRPNLRPEFVSDIETRLKLSFVADGKGDLEMTFGPEDVFNYIYAVLYSPGYRTRYAEFLKSDFPRIPLTSDVKLFRSLCGLGAELVGLHLLESPLLDSPIVHFPVKGSDVIEKGYPKYVVFAEEVGEPSPPLEKYRVYINGRYDKPESQYFGGIPPEVWEFHIGGYQVCEKWLKDRRGRTLTYDDQVHYCKIVTAIKETIRLMAEIDAAIPKWPIE